MKIKSSQNIRKRSLEIFLKSWNF